MYIEYVRNQRVIDTFGDTKKKPNANPEHIYNSPVPEYKPTWLVRVSDMQVVPGSSVNGHYWGLSYSWNQSGEITHKDGEDYERIDEGKHRITEYRTIPGYKMETASGFNEITDTDYDPETASTTFVAFEGLIQQVCKDFDIDYIWYDQMCINQSNHKEKMREIKQIHRIYANALCTVALVPELLFTIKYGLVYRANEHILPRTQWCKRMWTLEEAYASKDILFLGHNVHKWSNATFIWMTSISKDYLVLFPGPTEEWIACTVLWYAKNRMSSKAHDRIFALANVLPELMGSISFTYDQPFHDLMFQFYRALARKDISILWFGAPLDSNPEVGPTTAVQQEEACVSRPRKGIFKRFFRTLIKSGWTTEAFPTLQHKALPSWTGANGVHITQFALKHEPVTVNLHFFNTSVCYSLVLFLTLTNLVNLYPYRFCLVYTLAVVCLLYWASPSWHGKKSGVCCNYTIIGDLMRLESNFITARIEPGNTVEKPDDFGDPNKFRTAYQSYTKLACKKYDTEDGLEYYFAEDGLPVSRFEDGWKRYITCNGSEDLIFVTTSNKSHRFYTSDEYCEFGLKATHILPLKMEDETAINTLSKPTHYGGFLSLTEECSECIILMEPTFANQWGYRGYPVIKKDRGYYRSVGVFILDRSFNIEVPFPPKILRSFDII